MRRAKRSKAIGRRIEFPNDPRRHNSRTYASYGDVPLGLKKIKRGFSCLKPTQKNKISPYSGYEKNNTAYCKATKVGAEGFEPPPADFF
jgi:hypothetical protein